MKHHLAHHVAIVVALALLATPAEVTAFERVDAIALENGEDELDSAVIDPAGEFAYFGTDTSPGRVVKIDLETFQRVGAITLEDGEDGLASAVIDPAGDFAYFGTFTEPGRVVKVDLETFQRVDAITLDDGENDLDPAVIDPAGERAYFGTATFPGRVVKINLETFERVGAIMLESGENDLDSAVIDPAGERAYFGTATFPGRVVKIDLETFERVGAITLDDDENVLNSAVIDPVGAFAYFGTFDSFPGRVVKIDLETFQGVDSITLDDDEHRLDPAVIDPAGELAYFGTATEPGRVVKIDLETFERVDAITLDLGENYLDSAVIDPAGAFAHFGTETDPGRVVKIALQAFSPVDLAVDFQPLASDGNDVFEPGERVEAAPAWRNNGADDGSADGVLSNFTGPGGASYDVVQGGVGYGPVPPGETESCRDSGADCFQLEVLLDGPDRPALHWDATVEEDLQIGPSESIVHTWSLHLGDSFADVPRNHLFYRFVETALHHGMAVDCGDEAFCPDLPETREMLARTVLTALEGGDYVPDPCTEGDEIFADVSFTHPFCPWIEELSRRDIIAGCGNDAYCPEAPVTRAQIAVFLLKTLEGGDYTPPACEGFFADVPCPSTFADWIEQLADRGITAGCAAAPLEYCPGASITRGQCTVLQSRTFGLTLYGP